ncbi:hypothetical protein OG590_40570 (plasmid) [Streptomyces goshikiensis]|uniref:hypothetical protein n=1 Tax=Streptomyces goshikiensis TaxID=1942 RepID=UPI002F9192D6|nr:hypothetical protein OG590_40570 [Streptomyces goshikiensis]
MTRTTAATWGLLIPAGMALAMSADTSFRFLGTTLNITDDLERALLCGVAEAAIVALTVYAWATRTKGPAYLAYAAVLVQAVPAFAVSGSLGGTVRVALGPILLTVLLHLLLGLEVRMSGARPDGILAAALAELRERITASLGIGRRGADSAAIARSRAADKAVNLADAVAATTTGTWLHRRRAAKLAAAIDSARHGLDASAGDAAEAAIVDRVVRRKSVTGLANIEERHNWSARGSEVPPSAPEVPAASSVVPATRNEEVPAKIPAPAPVVPVRPEPAPLEVPAVEVPALGSLVPEVPQVPEQVPPLALVVADSAPLTGGSAEVSPQVNPGSALVPGHLETPETPRRGEATRKARELIEGGTTDPGTIAATLTAAGIKAPSRRYLRQLVSESRNDRGTGAYL